MRFGAMRAAFGVLLFCLGLFLLGTHPKYGVIKSARAQFGCGIGAPAFTGCGAVAAINHTALDGAVNGTASANFSLPSLVTSAAGEVVVFIEVNGGTGILTATGSSLGSFTQRATTTGKNLQEFFAISSGALAGETITINVGSAGFVEASAFGVKGVKTATNNGYDSNGALPAIASTNPVSISTSNNNDFLIVGSRNGGNSGVPAGWTQIVTGGFLMTAYQIVTATQSSLSVSDPATSSGIIGDALVSN